MGCRSSRSSGRCWSALGGRVGGKEEGDVDEEVEAELGVEERAGKMQRRISLHPRPLRRQPAVDGRPLSVAPLRPVVMYGDRRTASTEPFMPPPNPRWQPDGDMGFETRVIGTFGVPVDPLEWQIAQEMANSIVASLANTVGAAESVLRVAATGHDKKLLFMVVFTLYFLAALGRVVSGATVAYFVTLVGQSAPPEMLQMLTYLAMKHDADMQRVDTVRAYSFGALYFIECVPIWYVAFAHVPSLRREIFIVMESSLCILFLMAPKT
ncbi:hypothetical protein ACQ4PT_031845 [Festuca glaucescens]